VADISEEESASKNVSRRAGRTSLDVKIVEDSFLALFHLCLPIKRGELIY
jgi:hypothetical protein